ncbi:AAA family ATPase [Frankia sp. AiPs1]|uniref:ATP-binding protein n=1 Tax=Frankia sp. AiPa1 TaxID=573492 RepID=UPI00202B5D37|nr:ATP-binding protein [Frankia sp. AiPa1]MCL9760026.1 ATP-binding protein [Frankia sp. AiPa1]
MARSFNTAGPNRPDLNYTIPALSRLPEAPALVEQMGYFVVHAPRQTGKTTALRALAAELTAAGSHAALHFSCETGQVAEDDYAAAQRAILLQIRTEAETALPAALRPPAWPEAAGEGLLTVGLTAWARVCPRPIVLFFDEIDALRGQSLISVLRQLRSSYSRRPDDFPASVVLCGLRDVREYRLASGGDPARLGTSSPFNIKVESLRLGDFTPGEVRELYGQHTADTGQEFTGGAMERAFELTVGQPWLVNALAREVVDKIGVPRTEPVTAEHMDQAKERLILARATHLDSLAARLADPRVRRVLEPVLAGTVVNLDAYDDDLTYVRDLGLIAQNNPVRVANPIYREVIARVLADGVEAVVLADPRTFVLADGRFDMDRMIHEFADFWMENGEILAAGRRYPEAAAQLVFMGFLQRVVNGGGYVGREYGIGRGRIDLLVRWPWRTPEGKRHWQREAVELKVRREHQADPLPAGLRQLDGYLDRTGLDHGVLVVFDSRPGAPPITERTTITAITSPGGRPVTLLRA